MNKDERVAYLFNNIFDELIELSTLIDIPRVNADLMFMKSTLKDDAVLTQPTDYEEKRA